MLKLLPFLILAFIMLLGGCQANGATISDSAACKAIAGEAIGEPYKAKLWVACIIRNRGSLQGIYGANKSAAWYAEQPTHAKNLIKKAWLESAQGDVTGGCTKFGGKIDDWYFMQTLHLTPVATIGNTRFYK